MMIKKQRQICIKCLIILANFPAKFSHLKETGMSFKEYDSHPSFFDLEVKQSFGNSRTQQFLFEVMFWFSVNRTFGPFVITHHKRRKVHEKETPQLLTPGEGSHPQTSFG